MLSSVIQKVIFSPKALVERRPSLAGGAKFFVKVGSRVRPFDFVAEVKDTVRQRLTAGVGGRVVKLLPGKAILLETSAVIIRGVVGSGEDTEGEIRVVAGHSEPIEVEALGAACLGGIVVGGNVPKLEVFKKAEAVGVKGIVCGGADFSTLAKTQLPTLLTEGFGRPPLNRAVFDFLKSAEGRHVFLSPERQELLVARGAEGASDRLELFDSWSEEVSEAFSEAVKGLKVQVFTSSNFGQTGEVTKVFGDEVEVQLDSPWADGKIVVPGRNIGIIK